MNSEILLGFLIVGIILLSGCVEEETKSTTTTIKPETHPEYCEVDGDCGWVSCCNYNYKCMRKDALSCPDPNYCLAYIEPLPHEPCVCINNKCTVQPTKEVVISTDKTEYGRGETIEITIKNLGNETLYTSGSSCLSPHLRYPVLERHEDGAWKSFELIRYDPPYVPECMMVVVECGEFKSGVESKIDVPSKYRIYNASGFEEFLLSRGRYRFSQTFGGKCEGYHIKDSFTVYSNEFTIREGSNISGNDIRGGTNESRCRELGGFVTCDSTPEGTDLDCLCCFENYPDDCMYVR